MKKLLFLLVVFTNTDFSMAQDNKVQQQKHMQVSDVQKDYILMKEGKMLFIVDQETIIMDQEMVMTNGTIVSILGEVTLRDGITMMMKNGDMMGMDGIFIPKKKMMKIVSKIK
ncbi:MAG: Ni,Fe-hydrogenase I small subunit [Flavobacteriales bacterium]|jgi:Ni,Fe-hydrogenase I small subunit